MKTLTNPKHLVDTLIIECQGLTAREKLDYVINGLQNDGVCCEEFAHAYDYAVRRIILERS
uniref:Uncharacterized protein n=1 Tax=viral metagenome TaxID=1070528 RepID=A0A6M3L8Y9_9ZZZZ